MRHRLSTTYEKEPRIRHRDAAQIAEMLAERSLETDIVHTAVTPDPFGAGFRDAQASPRVLVT